MISFSFFSFQFLLTDLMKEQKSLYRTRDAAAVNGDESGLVFKPPSRQSSIYGHFLFLRRPGLFPEFSKRILEIGDILVSCRVNIHDSKCVSAEKWTTFNDFQ